MHIDNAIDHNINLTNEYLLNLDIGDSSYKLYNWYRISGSQKNINQDLADRSKAKNKTAYPTLPFIWVPPYDYEIGSNLDYYDYICNDLVLYFIAASKPEYNYEKRKNIIAYQSIEPFLTAFLEQLRYNKYVVQTNLSNTVKDIKISFHDNFGEKLYKAEGVLENTDAIRIVLSPLKIINNFTCNT